jgi:hypothetical protein
VYRMRCGRTLRAMGSCCMTCPGGTGMGGSCLAGFETKVIWCINICMNIRTNVLDVKNGTCSTISSYVLFKPLHCERMWTSNRLWKSSTAAPLWVRYGASPARVQLVVRPFSTSAQRSRREITSLACTTARSVSVLASPSLQVSSNKCHTNGHM